MSTAPDQQPTPYNGPVRTVIINNSSSSAASPSAAASAAVGGYGGVRRRRQSAWVHFWLLMCTAGIGNVLYAMSVSRWNRDRDL
ncbi:hypothetical protein [uncultured Streptomyces sp.]|uniref:hypothetical protein n=1 Tax=uncultured Streptomyces sp. TaxID=174707 RepID=UPI00262DB82D|nr:hypothetical protein [uncultured Streptomyces sp.]